MFTQTHLFVGAVVFARPGQKAVALAGLLGALVPDTDVWVMFIVERMQGATSCEVFHYRYWETPWTTLQMVLNAIPIYLALSGAGLLLRLTSRRWLRWAGTLLLVFAASALLHVIADFLLHHEDARAQWMPLSDWVFRSPVSYWNPSHFGHIFIPFEITLGLTLVIILGRRFQRKWVWAALATLSLGYVGAVAAGLVVGGDHPSGPGSCDALALQRLAAPASAENSK